jgi:hypothetical protein
MKTPYFGTHQVVVRYKATDASEENVVCIFSVEQRSKQKDRIRDVAGF